MSDVNPDPAEVLHRVNHRVTQDLDGGRFCTVFLGFVSSAGLLHWCSGGHGPMFLRCGGDAIRVLDATMPPLGILDELHGTPPSPVQMEPGMSLIAPSDGITECQSPGGAMLGVAGVIEALAAYPDDTVEQTLSRLRATVKAWENGREAEDDQTVVAVQRLEPGRELSEPRA